MGDGGGVIVRWSIGKGASHQTWKDEKGTVVIQPVSFVAAIVEVIKIYIFLND